MRVLFTINGEDFESLASTAEASKWAIVDRGFPDGTDDMAISLALVRSSFWLQERVTNAPEPVPEELVRCVVRLATYRAAGDFKPLPPNAASMSAGGITINPRYEGEQDAGVASRLGFPDLETYRLALPYIERGTAVGGVDSPSVFVDREYL